LTVSLLGISKAAQSFKILSRGPVCFDKSLDARIIAEFSEVLQADFAILEKSRTSASALQLLKQALEVA